ncbi:MAG: cell division protein ZapA [Verrucomicrobiaceae bacterium]|nr:MAG: cell division protein ZapA [Verrucomicrobiaceae bacterium]
MLSHILVLRQREEGNRHQNAATQPSRCAHRTAPRRYHQPARAIAPHGAPKHVLRGRLPPRQPPVREHPPAHLPRPGLAASRHPARQSAATAGRLLQHRHPIPILPRAGCRMSALIDLNIAGRTYKLSTTAGDETRLKALAARVDAMLQELKMADPNIDRDRQLILTCLQLVADLAEAHQKLDDQATAVTHFHRTLSDRLERLIQPTA